MLAHDHRERLGPRKGKDTRALPSGAGYTHLDLDGTVICTDRVAAADRKPPVCPERTRADG